MSQQETSLRDAVAFQSLIEAAQCFAARQNAGDAAAVAYWRKEVWQYASALAAVAPAGMDGWQPIATAPKDGRELLLATLNRRHPYIGKFSQYDLWCEPNGLIRAPTHWQPLPPPPAEGDAA